MSDLKQPEEQKIFMKEWISHNLNFKSMMFRLPEKEQFEISVYEWRQDPEGNEKPWWERVSGPLIVDAKEKAQALAQEHLQIFAKEMAAPDVSEKEVKWLQEYAKDPDAAFFDPANFIAKMLVRDDGEEGEYTKITASKIAIAHDLYLVEADSKWYTGILAADNVIQCWTAFPTLLEALDSLQEDFEI